MKRSRDEAALKDAALDASEDSSAGDASQPGPGTDDDPRAAFAAAHPGFATAAASAVSIAVGGGAAWRPEFTHQQFDGEVVLGYSDPRIEIRYSDPDLRMSVHFSARDTLPVGTTTPPDAIGERLRMSLPDGFPLEKLAAPSALIGDSSAAPPSTFISEEGPPLLTAGSIPPGVCVAEYSTTGGASSVARTFVIHRWKLDSPTLRWYHDRMSTLAMWLIESE